MHVCMYMRGAVLAHLAHHVDDDLVVELEGVGVYESEHLSEGRRRRLAHVNHSVVLRLSLGGLVYARAVLAGDEVGGKVRDGSRHES